MMAEMGDASKLNVMMMEKIWMLLPDIQAMKHMNAMFLTGPVARAYNICTPTGKRTTLHVGMREMQNPWLLQ